MGRAREMRLEEDAKQLRNLVNSSNGTIQIVSFRGVPPQEYQLLFRCRGIAGIVNDRPVYSDIHRVKIRLPLKYPAPSGPPHVTLLTSLFHPHVYTNGEVCIGDWETSEFLEEFVLRLGGLFQFDRRYLNVKDPANDAANHWAQKNLRLLPTDSVDFTTGIRANYSEVDDAKDSEDPDEPKPYIWTEMI